MAKAVVYGTGDDDEYVDDRMEFVYDDINYNDEYKEKNGIRTVFPVNYSDRSAKTVSWIENES